MNLFKYALKNLKTYKYRSIIMGITLVLVITASVVGLSIQKAAKNVAEEYRQSIGADVNIEVDFNKVTKGGYKPAVITPEQYQQMSELEYVKQFSFLADVMIGSDKIKAVGQDEQKNEDKMGMVGVGDNGEAVPLKTPTLKLIGGGGNADLPEFQKGARSIVEGNAPKNPNEAMISEELAELNNLKVGSTILLQDAEKKVEKEFTVTGIYEDKTVADGGTGIDMPVYNRRNEIITDFASAMSMAGGGDGMATVKANYQLNNPKDFEAFKKQARAIGISEDYTISVDEASYNKAVGPINNVNSTVTYFIVIILIIAAAVLTLLSILSVKERQYEIGVLRAMGMKKGKLALDFILESSMILFVAIVLGFATASVITKPIASSLLDSQIAAMEEMQKQEDNNNIKNLFSPGSSNDVKPVDKIDVSIDFSVVIQIIIVGFGIIIFANVTNIIYIMRFQPMEIMRRKN